MCSRRILVIFVYCAVNFPETFVLLLITWVREQKREFDQLTSLHWAFTLLRKLVSWSNKTESAGCTTSLYIRKLRKILQCFKCVKRNVEYLKYKAYVDVVLLFNKFPYFHSKKPDQLTCGKGLTDIMDQHMQE